MNKTIYVDNQMTWDEVKEKANGMNLTVSQYLLGGSHVPGEGRLDRIEKRVDNIEKWLYRTKEEPDSGFKSGFDDGTTPGQNRKYESESLDKDHPKGEK